MSTPGTVRDSMVTKITTLYSSKTRIPKPRALDQNNDNLMKDGYGIYLGPTTTVDDSLGPHFVVKSTEINVVISKKIYSKENDFTGEASVEDTLADERDAIINAVRDIISEGVDSNLVDLVYVGDDGGEFIFGDKNNYLAMTVNFAVQYKQDLTYCI